MSSLNDHSLTAVARAVGGGGRNRTGVDGFAGRCMTTLPPRQERRPARRRSARASETKRESGALSLNETGAGNESRTRDLNLGKVALYQLSYSRVEQLLIVAQSLLLSK